MSKQKPQRIRLSNRIWFYRKRSRYQQKDLAKLLGYKSASNISKWQNGLGIPTLENAIALSVALSTSVDALFAEHRRHFEERINPRREKVLSQIKRSNQTADSGKDEKSIQKLSTPDP